jgi:hypothetical protein
MLQYGWNRQLLNDYLLLRDRSTSLEDESVGEFDVPGITDWLNASFCPYESAERESRLLTNEIERSESHDDYY